MKIEYETFTEIAEDFISGEKISHILSDHSNGSCYIWQEAIREFASSLDAGWFKPNGDYSTFWDLMGKNFKTWERFSKSNVKEVVRTKRVLRKEITQEQCMELFGENHPKGHKIYMPYAPSNDEEHEIYYVVI